MIPSLALLRKSTHPPTNRKSRRKITPKMMARILPALDFFAGPGGGCTPYACCGWGYPG